MRVCIVRHGQTNWNKQLLIQGLSDIPLNETGKKQALDSANYLKDEKWDVIISSPLSRAYETAQIIADVVGYKNQIVTDERFIERDFGSVNGKEIDTYYELVMNNQIEDMESIEAIQKRTITALDELYEKYQGKNVLVTAHSHTIKGVLTAIDSKSFNFRTKLENACANYFTKKDNQWIVLDYNVSDHINNY